VDGVTSGTTANYSGALTSKTKFALGKRFNAGYFKGKVGVIGITNTTLTATNFLNIYNNYPDATLEAGKVLVRKWATTTLPSHGTWEAEENIYDFFRDLATLTGTATEADVANGKTFYSDDATTKQTGTYNPPTIPKIKTRTITKKDPLTEPALMATAVLLIENRKLKRKI
ncbi:MAG: hypothetical protein WC325_13750, partial [Candidatus Bathyarchaeia archaeon]